jgi:hypothetical protein
MIDLIPLFVVAVVSCAAMAATLIAQGRHSAQVNALLAAAAAERYSLARERWDLNTRISSPEVVRAAPPAPPSDAPPAEVLQALNALRPVAADEDDEDLDVDESFLVGTGPGEA